MITTQTHFSFCPGLFWQEQFNPAENQEDFLQTSPSLPPSLPQPAFLKHDSQSRPVAHKHGFDIWAWSAGWIKQSTPDTDMSGLWHYRGKHPQHHSALFFPH